METADTVEIGGYHLDCSPMTEADIPRLHELSVAVSWPHRADDWSLALALGTGWVARDQIGRVLGSAMWFPFSDSVASVGMVITSPRLQENGTGRWLMRRILTETEGRARVLSATKQAYRLYVSLGFRVLAAVYPEKEDAQAVRQQLRDQHDVDSYLFEISIPSVSLRMTGMRGQIDILEAAFLHAEELIRQMERISETLDRQEITPAEAAEELNTLREQVELVALRMEQRFLSPRNAAVTTPSAMTA